MQIFFITWFLVLFTLVKYRVKQNVSIKLLYLKIACISCILLVYALSLYDL